MPFRIVGYDGAAYRSQLQQERKKMLPVVTIVLYFGTDRHWNSRKKIKELMEIPRCLDTYVNDYQMHVFEVAWLTEEQISHFHSDFKVVANFFVQKRKGFQVKMRDTLKEFLKTELAVFLTIISVIILKNSMPTYPYIISFLIYGAISVIIYITCIFVAHKKLLTKYI